jgi:hypothetical protein
MNDGSRTDPSNAEGVLAALGELIEALDRRLPHVERLGEMRIAREAVALRNEAKARVDQLAAARSTRHRREAELSDARMADDGGPLPRK